MATYHPDKTLPDGGCVAAINPFCYDLPSFWIFFISFEIHADNIEHDNLVYKFWHKIHTPMIFITCSCSIIILIHTDDYSNWTLCQFLFDLLYWHSTWLTNNVGIFILFIDKYMVTNVKNTILRKNLAGNLFYVLIYGRKHLYHCLSKIINSFQNSLKGFFFVAYHHKWK